MRWLATALGMGLLAFGCHDGAPEVVPKDEAASLRPRAQPGVVEPPRPEQEEPDEDPPILGEVVVSGPTILTNPWVIDAALVDPPRTAPPRALAA